MVDYSNSPTHSRIWMFAAALFAIPVVATATLEQVRWGILDFAVFGVMIVTACLIWNISKIRLQSRQLRAAAATAIVCGFLALWVVLAVDLV